jgi:glutathione transport system ATP-binding protein
VLESRLPAIPPPAPLLSVEGLGVSFGHGEREVEAVRGLSFQVERGETVALVGESGSGKSATSLAVLRLVEHGGGRVASGSLRFRRRDGSVLDLARASARTLRQIRGGEIAMVFQEPMTSLNPVFTVGRQIAEAVRLHQGLDGGRARAEALRMLDLVRIPDAGRVLDRHPHQLSGGMRQRVMIAMALSCRPGLLIADEPTTALDVTVQAQILALVRALQDELGMGVLFVTHDMAVVAELADRVVVMRRGEKVEEGPAEQIFAAPRHPYTRALLDAVPRLGAMRGTDRPARFSQSAGAAAAIARAGGAPGAPVLEVRDLTARFDVRAGLLGRVRRRVHAVEKVSFELRAGETLALVGESGCGKSTTGRALLRLVGIQGGSVHLGGRDLAGLGRGELRQARREIQMVFQDPFASLDPRLTVGFSVAEPLLVHGLASRREADGRVAALLRQVGLEPDHARRYPHELSGGQRQRACIARALALRPKVIVADEPVSSLDATIRAQILDLLLDLQEQLGTSFLFISHDMAVVERVSHRVAVMYLGRIVELGPRRAIFEDPRHPYTRKLMAAVPVADPTRRRRRRELQADELPSPIRRVGDEPPPIALAEVAPGHFVAPPELPPAAASPV